MILCVFLSLTFRNFLNVFLECNVFYFHYLQFFLLRFAAAAEALQFIGGMFGNVVDKVVQFSATFVFDWLRFGIFWQPEECWETAHFKFWWHIIGCGIEFCDHNIFIGQFFTQLVEDGRQFFAMSAPVPKKNSVRLKND